MVKKEVPVEIRAFGHISELLDSYATNYLAKMMPHCSEQNCSAVLAAIRRTSTEELNTMWHMHVLRFEEWNSAGQYADGLDRAIVPVRCRGDTYSFIRKTLAHLPEEQMEDIVVYCLARAIGDEMCRLDILKIFDLKGPKVEITVNVGTMNSRNGELNLSYDDDGDIDYIRHKLVFRRLFFNAISTECHVQFKDATIEDDDDFVVDEDSTSSSSSEDEESSSEDEDS